jgi:hypothetical protein
MAMMPDVRRAPRALAERISEGSAIQRGNVARVVALASY